MIFDDFGVGEVDTPGGGGGGRGTLVTHTYTYDAVGNRTGWNSTTYTYDDADQLTSDGRSASAGRLEQVVGHSSGLLTLTLPRRFGYAGFRR